MTMLAAGIAGGVGVLGGFLSGGSQKEKVEKLWQKLRS